MDGFLESSKKKIMIVVGTRPEAIKLVPVIMELKRRPETEPIVVATAQHRQMLDQVLGVFKIHPDVDLDLMEPDQSLFDVTQKAIHRFENVLKKTNPDMVLVQGDTTTAFVGALAAFYQKISVGHVEAGLRTGKKYYPFPEEMNRKLVSVLSDIHFAPTEGNRQNLLREGILPETIQVTGNTVIDALFMILDDHFYHKVLGSIDYNKMILITAHRRENFGQPLFNICQAIKEMATQNPHFLFIYPVHLNNNVRKPAFEILSGLPNVQLLSPLDYRTFSNLMAKADLILTDSGGIQEEAPSLGKPVLVMRNETERPEAVEAGTVKIIGTERETIVNETMFLLSNREAYDRMSHAHNPYGDGKASIRIVDYIVQNKLSHK